MTKAFKRLTPDELRTFPGFENYSDEQAADTIESLVNLSLFFFDHQRITISPLSRQNGEIRNSNTI